MDFQILLIFLLCTCVVVCSSSSPEEVRYKIDKLVVACDPQNVASSDSISDIIIQKISTTGWKDVVKVLSHNTTETLVQSVVWSDKNMQNRASVVTSIVSPTSHAGLQMDVSPVNVACSDEGVYRCQIKGHRGSGGGKLDSQSSSVKVNMKAEPISINPITVSPMQPGNIYSPETILTMTCYGDVGNPPEGLRWCIKRLDMDISFMRHPYEGDITQGAVSRTDCQDHRTSILMYNVSKFFEQVDFRCETGVVTTQCGHTSAIAANVTIHRYKEDALCNRSSSTVTLIILSVLLAIVTVVLACVLLFMAYNRYFVQKRDRIYGDANDRRNVSEHAYDRTDYHMNDTSNKDITKKDLTKC